MVVATVESTTKATTKVAKTRKSSKSIVRTPVTVSQLNLQKVTLPTYDLHKKQWVLGLSRYQNNLANALHGLTESFMIDLSGFDIQKNLNSPIAIKCLETLHSDIGYLDGATGCRKKGLLIGHRTDTNGLIARYLKGSKRISHGSILFSECRSMFSLNDCQYVVMPDNTNGLGDCHGMITQSLYDQLVTTGNLHQIQFRFGVKDKWVAKGTLIPYPDEILGGNDLVFPESAFKGCMPPKNKAQVDDAVFGILHLSKLNNRVKTSHQVIANFESESAKQYLLDNAKQEMESLLAIRNDIPAILSKFIESMSNTNTPDELSTDFLLESNNIDLDSDDEQVLKYWRYAKVLKADIWGQLKSHPATVDFANQRLRSMILNTALGKSLNATSLMAAPLNSLRHNFVITSELKTGTYLYWRYPVRHYGDIRKVEVVNPITHPDLVATALVPNAKPSVQNQINLTRNLTGVFFINPDWFLEVGGDHDGDTACFLPAYQHIPLLNEVESWIPLPTIAKPEKKQSLDSLATVAIKAMSNRIGLFAWMMACCRQLGFTSDYAYLGEQITLEVDSFKSDLTVDENYINDLLKRIGEVLPDSSWLKFYKKPELYLTRTYYDKSNTDTIAQLINQTSALWDECPEHINPVQQSVFKHNPYWSYRSLFDHVEVPDVAITWATKITSEYNAKMFAIIQKYPNKDDITRQQEQAKSDDIKNLHEFYQDFANKHRQNTPEKMMTLAAAFHRVFHSVPANIQTDNVNSAKTNLICFKMFYPEYITVLKEYHGTQFRLYRNTESNPSDFGDKFWSNTEVVICHVVLKMTKNKDGGANLQPYLMTRDNKVVGRISTDCTVQKQAIPPTGQHFPVRIQSVKGKSLPLSYHQCEIISTLSDDDEIDF